MNGPGGGLRPAIGWLAFPVVPVALASSYHGLASLGGADPRLWGGWNWAASLGPLCGFGFLAGATLVTPDDPSRRGWRSWPSRRAAWVAVGPWAWPLLWVGLAVSWNWLAGRLPPSWVEALSAPFRAGRTPGWLAPWVVLATASFGWLPLAGFAVRRARRRRRLLAALARGLATMIGFVGSLIGGFWAATEIWRDYFFDPRLARVLLVAGAGLTLLGLSGCGTPTVGDVRRRDLFQAMLMAWVFGLAMIWRWLARRKC